LGEAYCLKQINYRATEHNYICGVRITNICFIVVYRAASASDDVHILIKYNPGGVSKMVCFCVWPEHSKIDYLPM